MARLKLLPLLAAILVGVYLRTQQWIDQVLIDDEWHLVHRLVMSTRPQMFLDFGYSDYSIPLGLLYATLAEVGDLSEVTLRLPMLVCGVATLVVLPWLVARRVGLATTTLFAWLLAISPLLILYSRMARPYAITLLLTWVAVFATYRFLAREAGEVKVGVLAVTAATLAIWLHLPAACFVAAPFLVASWTAVRTPPPDVRAWLARVAWLALPIALLSAALVLPPLLLNPEALALKSGVDSLNYDTLIGAWHSWLGIAPWLLAATGAALALYGAPVVIRAVPEMIAVGIGTLLALLLLYLSRPLASQHGMVLARYLLPALPLALLAIAAGTIRLAGVLARPGTQWRAVTAAGCGAVVVGALFLASQVHDWYRRPNGHSLHMQHYLDFRQASNPIKERLAGIPQSPFWRSLSKHPPGTRRVAVAPFYFESFDSDLPRWERESGQSIVPGFLSGLCVDWRWGEVPHSHRFDLRNAVRLADPASLRDHAVDLVVWQKPYRRDTELIGESSAHCEHALREKFGRPIYEDSAIVVFDPSSPTN